eukprot:291255_1
MTVSVKSCVVLNVDKNTSTITSDEIIGNRDNGKCIVSDCDEELLVLVEFKAGTTLQNISISASISPENHTEIEQKIDASPPKLIHIYKTKNINLDFDNIQSLKADKIVKCSKNKLKTEQVVKLNKSSKNALKFKVVKYLAIYIQSNQ